MKNMMLSAGTARMVEWLAKKFPYWFIKTVMMPGLSTFNEEEREQEFNAMRANPNFNLKGVEDFA